MNWMRVASPASLILVGSLIIHLGLAWLLVGSPEGLDRTWQLAPVLGLGAALMGVGFLRRDRRAPGRRVQAPPLDRPAMAALYWTIFLTFLALRLLVFRLDETRSYPDTLSYLSLAEAPVVDPSFWAGERPPALPLFYRLLGVTETRVEQAAIAQFVLSVAAWTTLAAVIAARLRTSWLRPAAFGLLLLFVLTEDISMWYRLLLSESISLSTLALLLVAWVVLLQPFRANAVASAESL